MPEITPPRTPHSPADAVFSVDFNDLGAMEGLEAVSQAVESASPVAKPGGWPEPMIPGAQKTDAFPDDVLPGVWGEMARAVSAATQTPSAMAVMCSLGVLATLFQRRYEVSPYGTEYTEPLSLFLATASVSGTRKTAVQNALLAPFPKWEKLQRDRYRTLIARANAARSTSKKRIEAWNQQAAKCKGAIELDALRKDIEAEELAMPDEVKSPRLFTGNVTSETLENMLADHSERMAVHSDEGGILAVMGGSYSSGKQNIDVYLHGHSGGPFRVDRGGRFAHVDRPALTVNLMLQPGMLSDLAGSKGFRDSGLIARFLFAVPETTVGTRDVRKHGGIDPSIRERYYSAVMAALEGFLCEPGATPPKAQIIGLSDAAREEWFVFCQEIEDNQRDGGEYEQIRDWTSKLGGATARIAALLELATVGVAADTVQQDSMANAIRLVKVLIPHARCSFGLLGMDAVEADSQAVLKWVRANGSESFSRRDAHRAMNGRFSSVERLKKALESLCESDCLRQFRMSGQAAGGRGRPGVSYLVNPALLG